MPDHHSPSDVPVNDVAMATGRPSCLACDNVSRASSCTPSQACYGQNPDLGQATPRLPCSKRDIMMSEEAEQECANQKRDGRA